MIPSHFGELIATCSLVSERICMDDAQKERHLSGAINDGQIREVLHGWFAIHAEEKGLSMRGENNKAGFLFYSMETKTAFGHYIMGYMAGRADALKETSA